MRQQIEQSVDVQLHTHERAMFGTFSLEWGLEAGERIAGGDNLPDGAVYANDLIAIGVIRSCTTAGLRIPEDLAVAEFDDIPLSRVVEPMLTTVRQPVDGIARHAVDCLSRRQEDDDAPPRRIRVQPKLIVRSSTTV